MKKLIIDQFMGSTLSTEGGDVFTLYVPLCMLQFHRWRLCFPSKHTVHLNWRIFVEQSKLLRRMK